KGTVTIPTIEMEVEEHAIILMVVDPEVKYDDLETPMKFQTVLDIDKNTPHLIADFVPPLHIQYINKESRSIKPYVKVGDTVTVLSKFARDRDPAKMTVKRLYFKSL